jgi:hypothetical protein
MSRHTFRVTALALVVSFALLTAAPAFAAPAIRAQEGPVATAQSFLMEVLAPVVRWFAGPADDAGRNDRPAGPRLITAHTEEGGVVGPTMDPNG